MLQNSLSKSIYSFIQTKTQSQSILKTADYNYEEAVAARNSAERFKNQLQHLSKGFQLHSEKKHQNYHGWTHTNGEHQKGLPPPQKKKKLTHNRLNFVALKSLNLFDLLSTCMMSSFIRYLFLNKHMKTELNYLQQ